MIFYMLSKNENERGTKCLTFQEMKEFYKNAPKQKFLWSGIKENSFGLIFGPPKSGKTIFCENLGMSIAVGDDDFFGHKLSGKPEKILFLGLEEFILDRLDRNTMQYNALTEKQKELVNENYLYQPLDFTHFIKSKKQWQELRETIRDSEAKVVFIDSITRMNHGRLEDSETAEFIMQNLREICYELKITLICIHHTPKLGDSPISMDSIKGSSTFAQESDFAIAIHRTKKGLRYMKNVFFRYANDDFDKVNQFEFDPSLWVEKIDEVDEDEILTRTDRRRNNDSRDYIKNYINSNTSTTFSTSELVSHLTDNLKIKERQIKSYLSDLVTNNKILSDKQGVYKSINFNEGNENEARE